MSDAAPEPRPGMKPRKPKDPAAPPKPPPHPVAVSIASPQELVTPAYDQLRTVVRAVLEGQGVRKAKISLALVDNATIHRLNKQFLQHDEPTDVITFPMSSAGAAVLEGEVVIGVEVAIEQARERGHAVESEIALYALHGALHLVGFDDVEPRDRAKMRVRERHWLGVLGLPPIAERDDA